ncbi:hypothetical protein [Algibacter sp. 2305UL17-15]|uniref:hypothetical protein n=1 Tax=Algibacter sp. 2305UL17-15 TaxID=3231268 RepID=UPI003457B7E1
MKKIIIAFLVVLIVGLIFLQFKFNNEITSAINTSLPPNIQLNYAEINTNVFTGKIELDSLSVKVFDSKNKLQTALYSKCLNIKGLSLWAYLLTKKITIKNITTNNPKLQYFRDDNEATVTIDSSKVHAFEKELKIKELTINDISVINGSFDIIKNKKDSLFVKIDSINFILKKLKTDAKKLKEIIPFIYKDVQFSSKDIFVNMNAYETLEIENLNVNNHQFNLQNLYIKPKFTKEVLSTKIVFERDHLQFYIPELKLNQLDFGVTNNRFFVVADSGELVKPSLKVYRDKRVADDMTIKKMYSEILRDLSFDLAIPELKIKQGYVSYAERVETIGKAGKIFFENVNSTLTNLTNTNKNSRETKVLTNSYFMGKAPMELEVSFNVNDLLDSFLASGHFKDFNAQIVNNFFESNLNAKAEGEVERIYFTFNGNKMSSKGDLKMKYKEFKFKILNAKNQVNKLLTAIGNIFVNDGSKSDKDGFRHGKIEVERHKNKSFFNYLWINVESGLISAVTGKVEKK